MLILNPRAVRGAYPTGLAAIMNIARAHECRRWLSQWPRIARGATPLRDLPACEYYCAQGPDQVPAEAWSCFAAAGSCPDAFACVQ